MNIQDRINDVNELGIFNNEEVRKSEHNQRVFVVLESIEYSQIYHLTDSELYYLGEDVDGLLEIADMIKDTAKGRIYCWN